MVELWLQMFRILYVCVFFFRQETAYEVIVRDWSSDVALPFSAMKVLTAPADFPVSAVLATSIRTSDRKSVV